VLETGRPLVFAHRGGSRLRPENTLAAFEHALALGVDGLELDVRLSRDGEVVVIHDAALDRTTDTSGMVADRTARELERVDAAFSFAAEEGYPLRGRRIGIARLADVLSATRSLPLIVELKGTDPAISVAAVDVVRRGGALGRVCFGGFSDRVVSAARRAADGVVTSAAREEIRWALYRSWVGLAPSEPAYHAFQVPERTRLHAIVTPRFVRTMHRAELVVQVWTVNEEADMTRLIGWGVNGLITDRPDVALAVTRAAGRTGSLVS
jgi:glycerophosphoryl diester phosphodiesterase